ncbi:MAG: hypothetical protein HOW73_11555 [Polyangiaceae bacterium]|nr:hypothetical protein [Polyangiaceae bacterium]
MAIPRTIGALLVVLATPSCFPSFDLDDAGAGGTGGSVVTASGGGGSTSEGTSTTVGGGGTGGEGGSGGGGITCTPGVQPWRVIVGEVSDTVPVASTDNHIQSIVMSGGTAFVGGYTEKAIASASLDDHSFFIAELDYLEGQPTPVYRSSSISTGSGPSIVLSKADTDTGLWVALGADESVYFYELNQNTVDLGTSPTLTCTGASRPSIAASDSTGYLAIQVGDVQASCDTDVPCVIQPNGSRSTFMIPLPIADDNGCENGISYAIDEQYASINAIALDAAGLHATSIGGATGNVHQQIRYEGSDWTVPVAVGGTNSSLPTFVTPLVTTSDSYVAGTTMVGAHPDTFVKRWDGAIVYENTANPPATALMRAAATSQDTFLLGGMQNETPPSAWVMRVGRLDTFNYSSFDVSAVVTAVAMDECGNGVIAGVYHGTDLELGPLTTPGSTAGPTAFIQFIPFDAQ